MIMSWKRSAVLNIELNKNLDELLPQHGRGDVIYV